MSLSSVTPGLQQPRFPKNTGERLKPGVKQRRNMCPRKRFRVLTTYQATLQGKQAQTVMDRWWTGPHPACTAQLYALLALNLNLKLTPRMHLGVVSLPLVPVPKVTTLNTSPLSVDFFSYPSPQLAFLGTSSPVCLIRAAGVQAWTLKTPIK